MVHISTSVLPYRKTKGMKMHTPKFESVSELLCSTGRPGYHELEGEILMKACVEQKKSFAQDALVHMHGSEDLDQVCVVVDFLE